MGRASSGSPVFLCAFNGAVYGFLVFANKGVDGLLGAFLHRWAHKRFGAGFDGAKFHQAPIPGVFTGVHVVFFFGSCAAPDADAKA